MRTREQAEEREKTIPPVLGAYIVSRAAGPLPSATKERGTDEKTEQPRKKLRKRELEHWP